MSAEFKILPYLNQVVKSAIADVLGPSNLQINIHELYRNGATRRTTEDRLVVLITSKVEDTFQSNPDAARALKEKSMTLKAYSETDIVNAVVDKSDKIEAIFSQIPKMSVPPGFSWDTLFSWTWSSNK